MIRPLIASLLGLVSPEILRTVEDARADADRARLTAAHALGRAEHADETMAQAYRSHASLVHDIATALEERDSARREIETLRSEASSADADSDEIDDLRARAASTRVDLARAAGSVDRLERERAEYRDQLSAANARIEELGRAEIRIAELEAELKSARADVVPVAEKCAWCLGPSEARFSTVEMHLCEAHGAHDLPVYADVRVRVALRAASCESRRVADPLAIACPTCGAMRGDPCYTI